MTITNPLPASQWSVDFGINGGGVMYRRSFHGFAHSMDPSALPDDAQIADTIDVSQNDRDDLDETPSSRGVKRVRLQW